MERIKRRRVRASLRAWRWAPTAVAGNLIARCTAPIRPTNRGHVNDAKLAAMVREQRQLKNPEARKHLIFAIQRYAAEQQYYVKLSSQVITASWQPYVKNYAPNLSADFGSRTAALWLER